VPIPTNITQGTSATPVNDTNWNELVDGIDNIRDYAFREAVFDVTHEDYGAVGDNVSDDEPAIDLARIAATANGGVLFFPSGSANNTYKISTSIAFDSDVTLVFAPGATLAVDTGVTVTINGGLAPTNHKIFTLTGTGLVVFGAGAVDYVLAQWWGAIGDDSTDCYQAFTDAIDALPAAAGMLYIPAGIYRVSASITNIPGDLFGKAENGTRIMGAGTSTVIRYMGTSGYCFEIGAAMDDDFTTNLTVMYCVISNLRIQATSLTAAAWAPTDRITGGCIRFSRATHSRIENVVCAPIDNDYGAGISNRNGWNTSTVANFTHDTDADFTYTGAAGAKEKIAIKWTPLTINTGNAVSVTVRLKQDGAADGTVHVEIWSDSGGPDAQILNDSVSINCSDITTNAAGEEVTFTWADGVVRPAPLATGSDYWAVLSTDSYTAGTLTLLTENAAAGEALVESFTWGGAWAAEADGSNNAVVLGVKSMIWCALDTVKVYSGSGWSAANTPLYLNGGGSMTVQDSYFSGTRGIYSTANLSVLNSEIAGAGGYCVETAGEGALSAFSHCYFDTGNLLFSGGGQRNDIRNSVMAGKVETDNETNFSISGSRPMRLDTTDPAITIPRYDHKIYTAQDMFFGYDGTEQFLSGLEFLLTTGLYLVDDDFALGGKAITLGTDVDTNEAIQIIFRASSNFTLPRGMYRIKVVAKSSLGAADFRMIGYHVNSDNTQVPITPNGTLITMTTEYEAYEMLFPVSADEVGAGTYLYFWKSADAANVISISHIIIEYLGADKASGRNLIAYSTNEGDADGDRASSVDFYERHTLDETLDETDFATHASWNTVGDFDDTGGNAAYTHAAGSGTLTQPNGSFANPSLGGFMYRFKYTVSGVSGSPAALIAQPFSFEDDTALDLTDGDHVLYFVSKGTAATDDFVISATSVAGDAFTLDDVSLRVSGGNDTRSRMAQIQASHDGAAIDQKGKLSFKLNDGSDRYIPTTRMTIDSAGNTQIIGDLVTETYNFAADAEASDTYVITLDPAPTAYTTGMPITFTANTANTGACTVNVNALGAKSLKVQHDRDPGNGYIESGSIVTAHYDGTNFQITSIDAGLPDYAGILVDENAVATTILLVDAYEPITIFDTDMPEVVSNGAHGTDNITIGATGVYEVVIHLSGESAGVNKTYEFDTFEIAASGDTITGVTQANPGVVTATGHSFSNGNRVKIASVTGMTELNGQIYTVANAGANDFELNDDNGAGINTTGYTAYSADGTAFLATSVDVAHTHRQFGAGVGVVGSMSGGGLASLTSGDTLEVHVKNLTDATNLTVESAQFYIIRH